MHIYCHQCGAPSIDGHRYCNNCEQEALDLHHEIPLEEYEDDDFTDPRPVMQSPDGPGRNRSVANDEDVTGRGSFNA